jgi:hypothetical protein
MPATELIVKKRQPKEPDPIVFEHRRFC